MNFGSGRRRSMPPETPEAIVNFRYCLISGEINVRKTAEVKPIHRRIGENFRAEIGVAIFDSCAQMIGHGQFDAAANRPAHLRFIPIGRQK